MDPNAALATIRQLAFINVEAPSEAGAEDLSEAVAALDSWLSLGGFLPDAWSAGR